MELLVHGTRRLLVWGLALWLAASLVLGRKSAPTNMRALNSRGKVLPLFAFLVLLLSFYSAAAADWPKAEIDFTVSRVIKILTDPMLKNREPERRKLLREAIAPQFDFRQMAKRSLGPYWRRQTSEQKSKFVRLFTDLVEKAYLSRIESYHRDKIIYTGERLSGDYAEVDIQPRINKGT